MALYGTFKYGDGTLYGATGVNQNLLYAVLVDWNEDGYYDYANEAPDRLKYWRVTRGREEFLRDSDQGGFAPYRVGKATLHLDNADQRYNPLNASSPLYPNVQEGKYATFFCKDGSDGDTEYLITGQIVNIELVGQGADAKAILTIEDGWRHLRDDEVSVALNENYLSSDAMEDVLDATAWPAIYGRDIGVGSETIRYWWEDGRSPSAALKDLADSEYGRFFIAKDGKATFRSRHIIESSVVSYTQSNTLKDISLANTFKGFRDKVTIKVFPRVRQATGEVWRHREIPVIPAGGSITIWGLFTYEGKEVPVISPISPVATTDYTGNTQADGGGTNLTADLVVTPTFFGSRVKNVVQNNSGSDCHLTLIRVRGDALSAPDPSIAIGGSGTRNFPLSLLWQQVISFANELAEFLADLLSSKNPRPIIGVENRFVEQFGPDLSSQVTATFAALSVAADYRIGYIDHESLDDTCQGVRSMFYLEPFLAPFESWSFPTEIGVTSVFGL